MCEVNTSFDIMSKLDKSTQPIGIFDSGIGGLTVAKALVTTLPHESIIYVGDTAHLPYGDKSTTAIKGFTKRIVDRLLQEKCKLILIACNSASAAAYDFLKEYVGNKALLVNVIDPTVEYLCSNYAYKKIGLIGTKLTVKSQIYKNKIAALDATITLNSLATPLLVPAIEEGFFQHPIIDVLLKEYLSRAELQNIEALILGCTHYPVIKESITKFYQNSVTIIDSAATVAQEVKKLLQHHHLLCTGKSKGKTRFLITDYTDAFAKGARMFFGEEIDLEMFS